MRILHINCNYIGTTLHQLMIEKLDELGHINQVFVPTYNKELSVIKTNSNVCVCECFKKWDRLWFDYKQAKILEGLQRNISLDGFEIIHAYTLFTDGNCAREVSKKLNIPYVVAVRNTDVNDFFRKMPHLRKRGVQIMRDAAAVFFLSEAYRKNVFIKYIPKKYYNEIKNKTYVIPNGIDDFWFNNFPVEKKELEKKVKIIYAGRVDRNKNIPTTQKAMKILRQKGYDSTLTVVGKVADKKEYSKIRKDLYTTCVDSKPKEELITFYREHNIFVMPSFTETFGLVYAEAMSQRLPVIYSKEQGFDNQFLEGEVGYHANARSARDVADAIEKVIANYSKISEATIGHVEKFRWKEIVKQYDEVYKNII